MAVRRPARSPTRRSQPTYRGINATPRDLLIFSCNPQACELRGLDEEVQAVQRAFARSADVRHMRNLDPKELQQELLSRPPKAFMFIGHANAEVDGEHTLAFCSGRRRELVAVQPETLARLLGEFSPARGGPLRLVFLNGCQSEDLGRAVLAAGVPHVVCWSTLVETKVKPIRRTETHAVWPLLTLEPQRAAANDVSLHPLAGQAPIPN